MAVEVRVLTPDQLDFAAFVELQKAAFAEVIGSSGAGSLLSEPYYRWKYGPPEGMARIALVYEDGALVAANSMYPLRARSAAGWIRAWQSCDTATHPKGRGRGHFMRCLNALREHVGADEVFFGFPNKNSTPGFVKFGWAERGDVNTFVRVLPGRSPERRRGFERVGEFGAEQDEFATRLAQVPNSALLDRSARYMNWRYFAHPLHRYEAFALEGHGRRAGVLVMRRVELFGRVFAVAMETLALDASSERRLLSAAAGWAWQARIPLTMVLNNTTSVWRALTCGYAKAPTRMLPKRQVLMGAAHGPGADLVWRQTWAVQIGDWDGF